MFLCKQQQRGPKIPSSHQSGEGRRWQRVEKEKPGELSLRAEVGVILPTVFFGLFFLRLRASSHDGSAYTCFST